MPWWAEDRWSRCTWRNVKTGRRCGRAAEVCYRRDGERAPWGRCSGHRGIQHMLGEGAVLHEQSVADVALEAERAEAEAAMAALGRDGSRHFDRAEFERCFRAARRKRGGVK